MGIEIRIAAPEDAFAACELLRRSISECCVQDHQNKAEVLQAWLGNKTPENVAGWFSSPSNFAVVAERDGAIVGVALLTQAGKLSLCYVLPEALHCGIGKRMLQAIEDQARQWAISVIKLHSTASAHDFYARNGYSQSGKEKSCYGVECDFFWKQLNMPAVCGTGERKRFCGCNAQ